MGDGGGDERLHLRIITAIHLLQDHTQFSGLCHFQVSAVEQRLVF
jgi:hypothetical protein